MARRIILGRSGSDFRFRVSQPGVDAATANLDDLIFDADHIPARVAATGVASVSFAPTPHTPAVTTLAHGASASLCIGVAQSEYVPGQPALDRTWHVRRQNPNVSDGQPSSYLYNHPELQHQWCTPWVYWGDDSAGDVQSCGWGIEWNATTISLFNRSANVIRVRWAALEF